MVLTVVTPYVFCLYLNDYIFDWNITVAEMLIRAQLTTLQMICEFMLTSKIVFKISLGQDDDSQEDLLASLG